MIDCRFREEGVMAQSKPPDGEPALDPIRALEIIRTFISVMDYDNGRRAHDMMLGEIQRAIDRALPKRRRTKAA